LKPIAQFVAVLFAVLLAGCSERASEAMRLLEDISARGGPSTLKEKTRAPERRTLAIPAAGATLAADLYTSPAGSHATLILVPGAAKAGKDDPRLVALANSLARVRFAVVVPELSGIREYRVGSADVRELVAVAAWLRDRPDIAPGTKAGMAAISYAVGPMLIAALDEAVRRDIGFLVSVGGYYDIRHLVTFVTTGYFREDGEWQHIEPQPLARWAFLASNAHRLQNEADRERLTRIARRKLDDPNAPVEDIAARLGPSGRAVYDLLTNDDHERVPALIAELPETIRAEMRALDPSGHDLDELAADVILIHGRGDRVIPYTESVLLDAALPEDQASLYLVDGLFHVDVDFSLGDRLKLWNAGIRLLEQRDRLAEEG